jgi:hypothetical protein
MESAPIATRSVLQSIEHAWRRLPTAVRAVLPPFLAVRIGLALFAQVSLRVFPPVSVPEAYLRGVQPVTGGIRGWLLGPWVRWDACWYLRIASVGYSPTDGTTAFFPLYPTLLRWLAPLLGGDHLLVAAVISHTACLLATILLYQITRQELDDDCARRAVTYQLFFPTAFFFFAPYAESLFTLWAIACLLAARREKWWLAGLCGTLASLTRVTGILLILPVALEMWQRAGSLRKLLRPRLASLGLIPLGTVIYSLYLAQAFGDPALWLYRKGLADWDRSVTWPWETLRQIAANLFQPLNNSVDALFGLLFIVLMILALLRLPAALGVYVGISMLPALLMPRAGAPLMGMPRYVLVLFPGFMALAWLGRKPAWHRVILYTCALLLAFFTSLYVAWFWVA